MTYIPFARKYRPQFFREVVGQETAVRTLKNAVKTGKVAHAYIFAGPRGVGKTTIARILAKALNCLNPQGEEPCGQCENCKAITKGNFPDLIEIDAASNRGIDDIRQLKETVSYAPIKGKYKVYIIDEAHMLTKEAFNALLKTLEEPPPRTVFILCTTELDKIIPTIQSRCQRLIFRRLPEEKIVFQLKKICEKEGITYEEGALKLIAQASEGCMRDATSILDQASIYCDNNVTETAVREFLGIVSRDRVEQFLKNLAEGDTRYCLNELQKLEEEGYNLVKFWEEVDNLLFESLVNKKLGKEVGGYLKDQPLEKLLYLEQITSKALSEAKFKEPSRVFKLAVLKASLVKDIIPLGELVKLARLGKLTSKEVLPSETPKVESEKPKEQPKEESVKQEQPKEEKKEEFHQPEKESVKEGKPKEEKKVLITRQQFVNKLIKDEIVEKPFVSMLIKYIKETENGLVVEIPESFYKSFASDIEKLKKYYGKYATFEVKEEVQKTEKKFTKLKNTRYLF